MTLHTPDRGIALRSRAAAVVALAAACLWLAACGNGAPSVGETPARAVRVALPGTAPAAAEIDVIGRLELRDEQQLAFRVPGIVAEVTVRAGETVTAGQMLARLNTTEVDAAVARARAAADKAERDYARGQRLRAEAVITQQQLDDLRTAQEVARAELASARFNQRFAVIRAPADGVVLRRSVEANETVAGGQPVLAVGNAGGGYVIAAALPDRAAMRVAAADPARITVDAHPDQVLQGRVSEVGRKADARTGTFAVDIAIDAAGVPLASGLLARARIRPQDAREQTHSSIPLSALVEAKDDSVLIFVVEDGVAHARSVRVRWLDDAQAVLEAPLPDDTRIVTAGAAFLRDGEAVRVVD